MDDPFKVEFYRPFSASSSLLELYLCVALKTGRYFMFTALHTPSPQTRLPLSSAERY